MLIFGVYISILKMVVRPEHVADNLNKTVNNYWNIVVLDETPEPDTNNRMQTPKFKIISV
jgi:hypothetical protein